MRVFQGRLATSAARMADALELSSHLTKELSRAYVYASMKSDEDTRDSTYQGMQQEMVQLAAELGAEAAYLEPEILKIAPTTIARFLAEEPRLQIFKVYLDDIQRRQAHTGTDGEERLLASAAVLANGPGTIYGILSDADFPYPTITLQRRHAGASGQRRVQRPSRLAGARGSRAGDVGLLHRARTIQGDVRSDVERAGAERRLLSRGPASTTARSPRPSTLRTSRRRSTRA